MRVLTLEEYEGAGEQPHYSRNFRTCVPQAGYRNRRRDKSLPTAQYTPSIARIGVVLWYYISPQCRHVHIDGHGQPFLGQLQKKLGTI